MGRHSGLCGGGPELYLRGAGCHQEGIGPARVVIVVHGRGHVQGHELQRRDEARQAAVAVLRHGVCLGDQEAHVTVCYPAVGVWPQGARQRGREG